MKPSNSRGLGRPPTGALLFLACYILVAFVLVTVASVFLNLPSGVFISELGNRRVLDALGLSLFTSFSATALTVVFGLPTAYLLARRSFLGRRVVDALIDLPLVLPPAVAGLALLLTFAPRGILGVYLRGFNLILPGSVFAVILAQLFVASPFFMRASKAAFEGVERSIENSARVLNPSEFSIFATVTLPLAARGVLAGVIMTWARAMGEFGATLMFAGNLPGVTQTMPLAIYQLMEEDLYASNALSAILIAISFTVLLSFRILARGRA